jgi:hypothetical protein
VSNERRIERGIGIRMRRRLNCDSKHFHQRSIF